MRFTKILAILFAMSALITSITYADDATQTDWSGGGGVTGPVTDWGITFESAIETDWSVSGELNLTFGLLDPPAEISIDNTHGGSSIFLKDLDADTDLDVVIGGDSVIVWYDNNGGSPTTWIRHIIDDTTSNGVGSVCAADVNGDGDMDILGTGGYPNDDMWWWESDGASPPNWSRHLLPMSSASLYSIAICAADIDGDTDVDIIGGFRGSDGQPTLKVWKNDGGLTPVWTQYTLATSASHNYTSDVYPADMNGDGNIDILSCAYFGDEVSWWRNNGGTPDTWTEYTIESGSSVEEVKSIYAEDINNDGDLDVIATIKKRDDVLVWINAGGSTPGWTLNTVDSDFDNPTDIYAVDINGDSYKDILAASWGHEAAWWENSGDPTPVWIKHTIDSDIGGSDSDITAADIDGDSQTEAICATSDVIILWEFNGYSGTGGLVSSIYDTEVDTGTVELEWGPISWSDGLPPNTTVSVEVRASNDSSAMGSWATVTSSGDDLTDYIDDHTRYFQYKVSLATTDPNVSPTFEDIIINWNPVGIDDEDGNIPTVFALRSAAPNPSSGTASIDFALPRECEVNIALYDIKGRKVGNLAEGTYQPGEYSATVSGLSSGVYVYSMTAGEFSSIKKMVVK